MCCNYNNKKIDTRRFTNECRKETAIIFLSSLYVTEVEGPHEWSAVIFRFGLIPLGMCCGWSTKLTTYWSFVSFAYWVQQRPMSHYGYENHRSLCGGCNNIFWVHFKIALYRCCVSLTIQYRYFGLEFQMITISVQYQHAMNDEYYHYLFCSMEC